MAMYIESLGAFVPDNLIAGNDVKIITGAGTIVAGSGELKRGTVLGIDSAGKLGVLGDTGLTAYGILCDDIDATAEVVAEVYLTGQFNTNALIVKESYTMTTTDIQALRNGGIFLENSMKF